MPLLGLVADRHGPRGALLVLTVIPLLAIAISTLLREPAPTGPDGTGGRPAADGGPL
ncbi:MAG TPA: hypothetical protein VGH88_07060 [Streptosporangiaceae bacterium]|jgi:FSR family fosmidomycin resistance protein-like MFS transporter